MIDDIFDVEPGECWMCEDCGERRRLQFGVCLSCGGCVVECEDEEELE